MPDPAVEFLLELGRALHAHGVPAHRLEAALVRLAERLGLEGEFFSTPTAVFAAVGRDGHRETHLLRVEPGAIDLEAMTRIDDLGRRVGAGELGVEDGRLELHAALAAPPRWSGSATVAAMGLASGTAARFFGGGWNEIGAATLVGLVIGALLLVPRFWPGFAGVFELTAAMTAAIGAAAIGRLLTGMSVDLVVVSSLIVLIPGLSLTVALNELATRHLVSGTARLAATAITFLQLAFGVALGGRLAAILPGAVLDIVPRPAAGWTEVVALILAPATFVVLFRAPPREFGAILLAGLLGFGGARFGAAYLGPEVGAFVGALLVGVGANVYSRVLDRPAGIPLVPGIMLLVPGSLGFRSLESLMDRQVVSGVEAAFQMSLVAISLVAGLLLSSVVVPPRRDL